MLNHIRTENVAENFADLRTMARLASWHEIRQSNVKESVFTFNRFIEIQKWPWTSVINVHSKNNKKTQFVYMSLGPTKYGQNLTENCKLCSRFTFGCEEACHWMCRACHPRSWRQAVHPSHRKRVVSCHLLSETRRWSRQQRRYSAPWVKCGNTRSAKKNKDSTLEMWFLAKSWGTPIAPVLQQQQQATAHVEKGRLGGSRFERIPSHRSSQHFTALEASLKQENKRKK